MDDVIVLLPVFALVAGGAAAHAHSMARLGKIEASLKRLTGFMRSEFGGVDDEGKTHRGDVPLQLSAIEQAVVENRKAIVRIGKRLAVNPYDSDHIVGGQT